MSHTDLDPKLLAAYRATTYHAGDITLRIGRRVRGLDRRAVLLTAWNPRSRRMPPGWNRRMQCRLCVCLRGAAWIRAAEGKYRRWQEEMLLAAIDPRRAAVLARRFRQFAIVVAAPGRKARLVLA